MEVADFQTQVTFAPLSYNRERSPPGLFMAYKQAPFPVPRCRDNVVNRSDGTKAAS